MIRRLARLVPDRVGVAVATLLATFVLIEVGSLRRMTLTLDEAAHYRYGWQIVNFDSTRFDNSKMPFSALNALPRKIATELLDPGPLQRHLEMIEFGRYATVLCTVLLGWLVFRWTRELYGQAAGLLALTVFVFDPNILAHGGLVTTDLYATWMMTLTVWSFWRFLNHRGSGVWWVATVSAVAFGLAQLAKYTSAYLVPILSLIALGYAAPELWALTRGRDWRALTWRFLTAAKYAAVYVAVFLIIVNIGYWGQDTFRTLASCEFRSSQFQKFQSALQVVPGLRVPVPWAYIEGMDWVLSDEREGANVYLLGQLGRDGVAGRRFPEYYAIAWLYKEPIATQVLLLLALGAYVARFRRFDFRRNEWPLACTVLFFAWYFTFVFNRQKGFRFALIVLPILFVFTGSLLRDAAAMGRRHWIVISALLVYLVVSVLSYYPHFLAYFNELVWDRKQAYRILVDSNLDWGQSGRYLTRYLRDHPDVHFMPDRPRAGTLLVSVNHYSGLLRGEQYRWLRENFKPVDHVAYSYLLFQVTPEALRRVTDPIPPDHADKVN